jgi:hypothetical protein
MEETGPSNANKAKELASDLKKLQVQPQYDQH